MVFFRTDSNSIISDGHIMRCLAISESVIYAGEKVHFLIADGNPVKILSRAGISYTILQSDWRNLNSDAVLTREILKGFHSVLVIDTYSVTKEYVNYLRPYTKVVYLGSKKDYLGKLDLLINYSADIDYQFYQRCYPDGTTLLLGPSFAPLRKEFQNTEKKYGNSIAHVLLTTGNSDKDQMVASILNRLLPIIDGTKIVFEVICGRHFDYLKDLRRTYENNPHVNLHENVKSMSSVMKLCDLAISANGTTVYELSAMGLPSITFAMVPEQTRSAESLFKLGVIDYCGGSYQNRNACIECIKERFCYYLKHNDDMIELAKRAHALINGNGCNKIVDSILQLVQ